MQAANGINVSMDRQVMWDMPCAKCGYNLRTLHFLSKCPECGELVAATYFGRGGRRENRMGRLAAGAGMIAVALLALLCDAAGKVALVYWPGIRAAASPVDRVLWHLFTVPAMFEGLFLLAGIIVLAYSRRPERWYDKVWEALCIPFALAGSLGLLVAKISDSGMSADHFVVLLHSPLLAASIGFLQSFFRSLWRGKLGVGVTAVQVVCAAAVMLPMVTDEAGAAVQWINFCGYALLWLLWSAVALGAYRTYEMQRRLKEGTFPIGLGAGGPGT